MLILVGLVWNVWSSSIQRKSSGAANRIEVSGEKVNASFIYGSSMVVSGSRLDYSATGNFVSLLFTEDMVFSETGMEVFVDAADYVYLYVDLAAGLSGLGTFSEPLSIHSNIGWEFRSQFLNEVTYGTEQANPEPLLGMAVRAEQRIHAWLND